MVLKELGERLLHRRVQRRLTQVDLAEQSGISLRTIKRIEAGQSAQMASVVRILRALGALENLDVLVPEAAVTPMERLAHHGKPARRVRRKTGEQTKSRSWKWGTETR